MDWLKKLTMREEGHWCSKIYNIVIDGTLYAVATNGRIAAYVKSDEGSVVPEKYLSKIIDNFTPKGKRCTATLAQLREFCPLSAGEVEVKEKCEDCNGTGIFECPTCCHEAECDECEGKGVVTEWAAEPLYGYLCGLPINREFLGRALHHVDGDAVEVWTQEPYKPFWIVSTDWRIAQMGMKIGNDGEGDKLAGKPDLKLEEVP